MEKVKEFVQTNFIALLVGALFYALFVYYNWQGNSICDCETTESYRPAQGNRSVNHFYHK
jgi:predicted negative regulator of RcsB-dependent stress response